MDLSAQQVLPTNSVFWLNTVEGLDRMLISESKMYLCLLLELSYSLPSCFVRGVLVQGLMTVTYSVVLRDLFSQCAVEPLLEMRVDTTVAVAFAILVIVSILESVSPFLF